MDRRSLSYRLLFALVWLMVCPEQALAARGNRYTACMDIHFTRYFVQIACSAGEMSVIFLPSFLKEIF